MKKEIFFNVIFLLLFSYTSLAQNKGTTAMEDSCINLFKGFKNYMESSVKKREDIADSAHLNYLLENYLFANIKPDSSEQHSFNAAELSQNQLISLTKEMNDFCNFLLQHAKDSVSKNLTLMPIRMSGDKSIYNSLTEFQKKNTFILHDKRFPSKPIAYLLFFPPVNNIVTAARIWSFTLEFKLGKYFFKSITGQEGYEYIFRSKK